MDNHTPLTPGEKMHQYRARLRASGLRPMQIWVPDTRARGFVQEVQRQSRLVSASKEDRQVLDFVEAVADDEGWNA